MVKFRVLVALSGYHLYPMWSQCCASCLENMVPRWVEISEVTKDVQNSITYHLLSNVKASRYARSMFR